jgi:hypothetical protein
MFAASVTVKLLILYFALRYGDEGPTSRPWKLSFTIAAVFSAFDILSGSHHAQIKPMIFVIYLCLSLAWMLWYHRIQNVALSILVGAIGAVALFLGVPVFVSTVLE